MMFPDDPGLDLHQAGVSRSFQWSSDCWLLDFCAKSSSAHPFFVGGNTISYYIYVIFVYVLYMYTSLKRIDLWWCCLLAGFNPPRNISANGPVGLIQGLARAECLSGYPDILWHHIKIRWVISLSTFTSIESIGVEYHLQTRHNSDFRTGSSGSSRQIWKSENSNPHTVYHEKKLK